MINIQNQAVVEFTLGSYTLKSVHEFKGLLISETVGLGIPIFQITLRQNNFKLYNEIKVGRNCTIKFGHTIETLNQFNFVVVNYSYGQITNEGALLTISGMLDVRDFITQPKTDFFNNKATYQVLGALNFVKPKINYISDDTQIWLRPNITEKEFAEELLLHSHIPDSFVIFGLNIKKELIVYDAKKKFAEEPKTTFINKPSQSPPSIVSYDNFTLESDNAIINHFLTDRVQPIQTNTDWKINYITADTKAINGKNYYEVANKRMLPPKIDCGNCHGNYYNAEIYNLTKWSQLLNHNIYLTITQAFLTEDDLTLLDKVKLTQNHSQYKGLDNISGDYIIGQKEYMFSTTSVMQKFRLNRDFTMK